MANSFNGNPCNNCDCQDGDIFGDNTLSTDGLLKVTKNVNCSHTLTVEAPIFVDSDTINFTDSVVDNVQTVIAEVIEENLDACAILSTLPDTGTFDTDDRFVVYDFVNGECKTVAGVATSISYDCSLAEPTGAAIYGVSEDYIVYQPFTVAISNQQILNAPLDSTVAAPDSAVFQIDNPCLDRDMALYVNAGSNFAMTNSIAGTGYSGSHISYWNVDGGGFNMLQTRAYEQHVPSSVVFGAAPDTWANAIESMRWKPVIVVPAGGSVTLQFRSQFVVDGKIAGTTNAQFSQSVYFNYWGRLI